MTRSVSARPGVAKDIARIARSIGTHVSAVSAATWQARIEAAIRNLAVDADRWPEADEAAALDLDLKCRMVGRGRHIYRILFTRDEHSVEVLFIRHASRDQISEDDL